MLFTRFSKTFALLACSLLAAPGLAGDDIDGSVTIFPGSGIGVWEERSFVGHTQYELRKIDGREVIRADSNKTASGLFLTQRVDLEKTPWLRWRWRVDNILNHVDERSKAGDDYPARIYVVVSGGLFFWRTRAINYVWSNNQPVGSQWNNAYTGNARMIAVASGNDGLGEWREYKRNVREDLKAQFGEDLSMIDAIAIMTDTDNSGQKATAWYGDIRFTAR